jgi:TPR repeat protein
MYERAISYDLKPAPSLAARAYQGLKQKYGPQSPSETREERIITIDDKDTELDIVVGLISLGRLQWNWLPGERNSAVRNFKIAAFEYDDPSAYWHLASDLEKISKVLHRDVSVDNAWILHVPYEWYEYTMKAAVSGHAAACYNIGSFHLFSLMEPIPHIDNAKLRRTLLEGPMTDSASNRLDTTYRWMMCAGKAGYGLGYLVAQFVVLRYGKPFGRANEYQRDVVRRIARGESTAGTTIGDLEWSEDARAFAKAIKQFDAMNNAVDEYERNGFYDEEQESVPPRR